MLTKLKHIYGNGCSFTHDTHMYLDLNKPTYLDLLANKYQLTCTNSGVPGSCNRRIIRHTLRDACNLDSSSLVIVQLTFLERTEKSFSPGQRNDWKLNNKQTFEEYHESIKGDPSEYLNAEYFKIYLKYFDARAEITNLATDLIMLCAFLSVKKIPYFIFPYMPLVSSFVANQVSNDRLQTTLSKNPCVLNILTDSLTSRLSHIRPDLLYYDSTKGQAGHLSPAGHLHASEILDNLLTNQHGELK